MHLPLFRFHRFRFQYKTLCSDILFRGAYKSGRLTWEGEWKILSYLHELFQKIFKRSTRNHRYITERIKCITLHPYIMTEKLRKKKDDKPSNKNSNEMPSLKDYKSKEE